MTDQHPAGQQPTDPVVIPSMPVPPEVMRATEIDPPTPTPISPPGDQRKHEAPENTRPPLPAPGDVSGSQR